MTAVYSMYVCSVVKPVSLAFKLSIKLIVMSDYIFRVYDSKMVFESYSVLIPIVVRC